MFLSEMGVKASLVNKTGVGFFVGFVVVLSLFVLRSCNYFG